MERYFNVAGACNPKLHYMVDLTGRLEKIKGLVERGAYFTINRARQYGKTTILNALKKYLSSEYYVINLDFQMQMSHAKFRDENSFSTAFVNAFCGSLEQTVLPEKKEMTAEILELRHLASTLNENFDLVELFVGLSKICSAADKPIVLIVDEVDSAANNQVFLDFLAQLRGYYIHREEIPTFQSVILAGVYDVKNIQRKIRPGEAHKANSPWNIAAEFNVKMSFSAAEIAGMLEDYEADHLTGMAIDEMAGLIYDYTSGYPYLVSRLCKLIDENISESDLFPTKGVAWTKAGFLEALGRLLNESNTLFESLRNKLVDYPVLHQMVYELLFNGREIPYNALNEAIEIAAMFGFVKNENGRTVIANRIFETVLYNYFLSDEILGRTMAVLKSPGLIGFEKYRKYAVVLPLVFRDGVWQLLFEVRAASLHRQPGEICFPGGHVEDGEAYERAALRECCEELLLPERDVEILAPLDVFISPFDLIVFPYLARLADYQGSYSRAEVAEVFTVPLAWFEENAPDVYKNRVCVEMSEDFPYDRIPGGRNYPWGHGSYETVFYYWKNHTIWGLTALILRGSLPRINHILTEMDRPFSDGESCDESKGQFCHEGKEQR